MLLAAPRFSSRACVYLRRGSEVVPPKGFGGGFTEGFGGLCLLQLLQRSVPVGGVQQYTMTGFVPKGTSEATDRFVAGEPGSSGRLDARGAGSSVTVAAKGSRYSETKSSEARHFEGYSGWSDFGVWWIKSSAEARCSMCAPDGDTRRYPTKVSEVEVHRRHGPVHGLTEFELGVATKSWWSTPEVVVRRPKGFDGFGSKPSLYRRLTSVKRRPSGSRLLTEATAPLACEGGLQKGQRLQRLTLSALQKADAVPSAKLTEKPPNKVDYLLYPSVL
ncbi:hypothetical protein GUJ93_ZPchr0002g24976 [Zizania palustris]|uniref:Uncharacterized protein n=1 Tax=Zizania palustris TaxID=103762 RepID=A0A8J5S5T7_ZIZPA|nr:hypothetical protein GUJ93_ZPchr0002g24976 [Zizania palustris]